MASPDAGDLDKEKFPYKGLPNPAKVVILSKIHDPQDKLNILRMMPQLTMNELGYNISGWDDYKSLQFELIYPMVFKYLKWPYDKDTRGWKNLLHLCKVSPSFHKIVTTHFEKHITLTRDVGNHYFREYQQEQIWRDDGAVKTILAAAPDKTSSPWHTTLPFGIATNLAKGGQIPWLTKLGGKVWSLWLSQLGAYTVPGSINYLVECLHLVPNLRRLVLEDLYPPQFNRFNLPPEVLRGKDLVLPELPHLKMISLVKDCNKVQKWIFPKYCRQLEVLDFEDSYLAESFEPTCFPKLETVNIIFTLDPRPREYYLHADIEKVNDLMKKILLAPLKTITVQLDKVNMPKFFNFMLTLNQFGGTLNTLEMKFITMDSEMEDETKNGLQDWIKQLNFPKLNCLHLENYSGPLEFLLSMRKSLKKLNIVTNSLQPLKSSKIKGLKFEVKRKDMLGSSIWVLFPVLDWLQVDLMVYQERDVMDGNGRPSKLCIPSRRHAYNISRKMYDSHKNKLKREECKILICNYRMQRMIR